MGTILQFCKYFSQKKTENLLNVLTGEKELKSDAWKKIHVKRIVNHIHIKAMKNGKEKVFAIGIAFRNDHCTIFLQPIYQINVNKMEQIRKTYTKKKSSVFLVREEKNPVQIVLRRIL